MIPSAKFWAIAEIIYDALFLVVTTCVVNQHRSYWLLSDALASTIKLYVQLSKDRLILQVEVDVA